MARGSITGAVEPLAGCRAARGSKVGIGAAPFFMGKPIAPGEPVASASFMGEPVASATGVMGTDGTNAGGATAGGTTAGGTRFIGADGTTTDGTTAGGAGAVGGML